jgi:hypothetical protein
VSRNDGRRVVAPTLATRQPSGSRLRVTLRTADEPPLGPVFVRFRKLSLRPPLAWITGSPRGLLVRDGPPRRALASPVRLFGVGAPPNPAGPFSLLARPRAIGDRDHHRPTLAPPREASYPVACPRPHSTGLSLGSGASNWTINCKGLHANILFGHSALGRDAKLDPTGRARIRST